MYVQTEKRGSACDRCEGMILGHSWIIRITDVLMVDHDLHLGCAKRKLKELKAKSDDITENEAEQWIVPLTADLALPEVVARLASKRTAKLPERVSKDNGE
jgi:hypothetical protein